MERTMDINLRLEKGSWKTRMARMERRGSMPVVRTQERREETRKMRPNEPRKNNCQQMADPTSTSE